MFLKNSLEKTSVNTLNEIRHDLLLNFSEDTLFEEGTDRTFLQSNVELPYPIHQPFKTADNDVVKQLIEDKSDYLKLLEVKKKRYKFDKRDIRKEKIGGEEYIYLPRHLLEFYTKKDPECHFSCDYNCYYTGGVLDHVQLNERDYLIRSDADNILCLTNLRKSKKTIRLDCGTPTPIHSINSVKSGENNLLVLREKCRVSVVELSHSKKIIIKWTKEYNAPIFDAKLNPYEPSQLGIINYKLKFNIRDVETSKTLFNFVNSDGTNIDNFQQFRFLDQNTIILIDRSRVKIIDHRAKNEAKLYDPQLIDCNSLCNFDMLGNSLLLASRHYLMKTDLRYLQNLSHFSHSLTTPPCYMDLVTKGRDTYLCLASQENKVLFTGKSLYSLPTRVPGIKDTLKECLLRNPSLFLFDRLDDRLNFSTSGLKVVNLDDEVFIYWTNTLGDIFRQKISDNPCGVEKSTEALFNWTEKLEKPNPMLHLTHIEEMSRARFSLNNTPIESNLKKYNKASKASELLGEFGSRYSKNRVLGTLAKDFISVWEDSDEEEEEVEDLPEVASNDKVTSWIQTHDFSDNENSLGVHNLSNTSNK